MIANQTILTASIGVRRALAALAACVLVACGDRDEATVSVNYVDVPQLPRNLLSVTMSDGARTRVLRADDIGAPGRYGPELATRRHGDLRIGFRFASSGVKLSEGEVTVPLRSDWRYSFTIRVDTVDPFGRCLGCMDAKAFPLAPAYQRTARDSVWLIWSGNNIRNPVVY